MTFLRSENLTLRRPRSLEINSLDKARKPRPRERYHHPAAPVTFLVNIKGFFNKEPVPEFTPESRSGRKPTMNPSEHFHKSKIIYNF